MGFMEYTVAVVEGGQIVDSFDLKADTTDAVAGSWIKSGSQFLLVLEAVHEEDPRGGDSPSRASTTLYVREETPPEFILRRHGLQAPPTRHKPLGNVIPLPGSDIPRAADDKPVRSVDACRATTVERSLSLIQTMEFARPNVPVVIPTGGVPQYVDSLALASQRVFVIQEGVATDRPTLRALAPVEDLKVTVNERPRPLVPPSRPQPVTITTVTPRPSRRWVGLAVGLILGTFAALALLLRPHPQPPVDAIVMPTVALPPADEPSLPAAAPPAVAQPVPVAPHHGHHHRVVMQPPSGDPATEPGTKDGDVDIGGKGLVDPFHRGDTHAE